MNVKIPSWLINTVRGIGHVGLAISDYCNALGTSGVFAWLTEVGNFGTINASGGTITIGTEFDGDDDLYRADVLAGSFVSNSDSGFYLSFTWSANISDDDSVTVLITLYHQDGTVENYNWASSAGNHSGNWTSSHLGEPCCPVAITVQGGMVCVADGKTLTINVEVIPES